MRLIPVLLVFFCFACMTNLSAQNCCASKKTLCKNPSKLPIENNAGMSAALADSEISIVTEESTGVKRYVRKLECPATGSISYQDVIYSSEEGKFVCDPSNCDPTDCIPRKCDPSKCKTSTGNVSHDKKTIKSKTVGT